MNGKTIKELSVVVMDGTDKDKVDYIQALIWEWSDPSVRQIMVYELGKDHPSTIVMRTKIDDESAMHLQNFIERRYPGLCMFNPPMTV